MLYWWKLLNIAVFYGKLHQPIAVNLVKHHNTHAWTHARKHGKIGLSIQPMMTSRKLLLSILVHEMVHAWEHHHEKSMGHGKQFFQWKSRIKRTTSLCLTKVIADDE